MGCTKNYWPALRLRLFEFRLSGATELACECLIIFTGHAFQRVFNLFPFFAFVMDDGGLQESPITLIGGLRNSERRLPGTDGFGVRERGEVQECFCAIGGVLEPFGGQFDGDVVFADSLLGDLLGFDFVMPCGGFSERAEEGGVIMSVKRLFWVELDGLVERAECLLNAAGLAGL